MDLGLAGKNVVITGASRGIGRATALQFASEGANVAICARGLEALEKTEKELRAHGGAVFAKSCDVSYAESLTEFLGDANKSLGGVDILVNNPSGFGLTDDEAGWDAGWSVDMMASVRAVWQVTPWMEARGGGAIVHISSISGLETGSPPAYTAVKAALIAHAKSTAAELAPKNIRVNCIAPGSIFFEGGFWEQIEHANKDMYDATLASIPFGRMGTPEEVANAVVFMASPAASWVSGSLLLVDGVQHKGVF
jgi:3-oxoacyl-[acyl-carrier protein] reductase